MAKQRLAIKVGEYQDKNDPTKMKGEYVKLGVMLDGQNGAYILIDPSVSLAGCLQKQNMMNHRAGKEVRDTLMVSVFDDQQQTQQPNDYAPQGSPNNYGGSPSNGSDDTPF